MCLMEMMLSGYSIVALLKGAAAYLACLPFSSPSSFFCSVVFSGYAGSPHDDVGDGKEGGHVDHPKRQEYLGQNPAKKERNRRRYPGIAE